MALLAFAMLVVAIVADITTTIVFAREIGIEAECNPVVRILAKKFGILFGVTFPNLAFLLPIIACLALETQTQVFTVPLLAAAAFRTWLALSNAKGLRLEGVLCSDGEKRNRLKVPSRPCSH